MTEQPVEKEILADGFEFARGLAKAIRELTEDLHAHQWDVLGIWNSPENRPVHPRLLGNMRTTVALIRCSECGLPQTIELEGIWTTEQVRGQASEKPASDDQ